MFNGHGFSQLSLSMVNGSRRASVAAAQARCLRLMAAVSSLSSRSVEFQLDFQLDFHRLGVLPGSARPATAHACQQTSAIKILRRTPALAESLAGGVAKRDPREQSTRCMLKCRYAEPDVGIQVRANGGAGFRD